MTLGTSAISAGCGWGLPCAVCETDVFAMTTSRSSAAAAKQMASQGDMVGSREMEGGKDGRKKSGLESEDGWLRQEDGEEDGDDFEECRRGEERKGGEGGGDGGEHSQL